MKTTISKATLQEALEIVKPGLASKEIIEQATAFAFIEGKVVTYNDEISISHPVEGLEITGAIQAEELYQILKKIKKDEIEVEISKSEIVLSFRKGKAKVGLILQQEIKLPLDSISEIGKWKRLPENFVKYLGFALSSASKDMSKPVLTCVNVKQSGVIEASDDNRITKCTIDEMPVKTFLLPASSAVTVVKLNPIKIAEGTGWIHFKTEKGSIISCRIFDEDKYPNTDNVFNVKGTTIEFPESTKDILEKAAVFAKREHISDECVYVTIEDKLVKVRSESNSGWFEEEVKIDYAGEDISIAVNPNLLKEILAETRTCVTNTSRMKFAGEKDSWVYVTALRKNK